MIDNCMQCKKFILCFHKKKNELIQHYPGITNDDVYNKMHPCKDQETSSKS